MDTLLELIALIIIIVVLSKSVIVAVGIMASLPLAALVSAIDYTQVQTVFGGNVNNILSI